MGAVLTRENDIALPPEAFRRLVCGVAWREFEEHGEALANMMREHGLLGKDARLLDVGCGCGRIARWLLDDPLKMYVGFDRHEGMIEWCRQHLTLIAPHFEFYYFDIKSAYTELDGVTGTVDPREFEFPFADRSFDSVLLVSVFTHMPLPEIAAYLANLERLLAPGGRVLLSVFFAQSESEVVGLGFYHRQEDLEAIFTDTGLEAALLWPARYGPKHNWYLLRRAESE